ncbi:hypothetical protein I4F81_011063 [Pyropia yezoensis]|uniref:Uncharacterized protein n=1 Tax=Pyropia yezoensis TaxID=2788 RepID=A0ACC3CFH9_PYRYE|nr:hypothetical protein I4F81_011063 [Neopyropia yezoensis]
MGRPYKLPPPWALLFPLALGATAVAVAAAAATAAAALGGSPHRLLPPPTARQAGGGGGGGGGGGCTPAECAAMAATNSFRAASGLPALAADGAMMANARAHSAVMARRGSIFHQPIGSLPTLSSGVSVMAENVAMGSSGIATGEAVGQAVFTQWKNSPGHRANMLRAAGDTVMVVGIHVDGAGAYWGTQTAPGASF